MVIDSPAGYLLLGTAEGVSPSDLDQVRRWQTTVLAIEPPANDLGLMEPADQGREQMVGRMVIAPWLRMSPAWLSAADPQQALGTIHSARVSVMSPPQVGSLFGRLYDALDMLIGLMGMPDSIDAALTGPLGEIPDDLRALTGHLTAHLRFGQDTSAVMHVSDRSGFWARRLVAMGTGGQLVLEDNRYRLFDGDGAELDASEPAEPADTPAALIAAQWRRMIDSRHAPLTNPRRIVACCETAILSCKTGNAESTETLIRIRGA